MDEKSEKVPEYRGIEIVVREDLSPGQAFLLSPRRRLASGDLEPESEWLKRCAAITGPDSEPTP